MSESVLNHVTIAKSGPENVRNDTACVVELDDRRLMVVWHKYEGGTEGGHDLATCRIYAKTSSDGGMSWQHERMLVDVETGDMNVQAPALALLPSGELLMICLRAHRDDSTTMCLFRSQDNGDSFHEAGRIWQRSTGQWLQGGANSIVILTSGRLLVPCHGGEGGQFKQHNKAWCFLSDDDGHTWRKSQATVDLPMRGAMEACVAELEGGRLCMSLRTQLGSVFLSYSDDGGETWSLAQTSGLKAPESGTCLRRIPGTNKLLLIWNDGLYDPRHHHYGRRTPLSMAVSQDAGKSWKRTGDIDSGEYEFTNVGCTFLKNGNAIVTYMRVENPEYNGFRRTGIDLCAAIVSDPEFGSG